MKTLKHFGLLLLYLFVASCEKWELDADCSEGIPESLTPIIQGNSVIFKIDGFVSKWQILDEASETILKTSTADSIVINLNTTPNGVFIVKALLETSCGFTKELVSQITNQESLFPKMVEIPRGRYSFVIADTSTGIDSYYSEAVQRFYMAETEITQEVYNKVMPQKETGCPKCPIVNVTWIEAVQFCNRLSELAGLEKVYTLNQYRTIPYYHLYEISPNKRANGYRLPTRLEWENAATIDDYERPKLFGFSNSYYEKTSDSTIAEYANLSLFETKEGFEPVASYKPDYGLYDLAGNVGEWIDEDNNNLFLTFVKGYSLSYRYETGFINYPYSFYSDFRLIAGGNYSDTSASFMEGLTFFSPNSPYDDSYRTLPGYFGDSKTGFRVAHN